MAARVVAELRLDSCQHKTGLAWSPDSQRLAITFRVQQSRVRGVHIFSCIGPRVQRTTSCQPCPPGSVAWLGLDLQPQTFQWSPASTHVAAWVGDALVILAASDCSVTASLPVSSLLGSSTVPAGCTYVHCNWLAGPGRGRLLAYAEQTKYVTIFSLAGQQLRKESTPIFTSSPVWGALGCAAYLTPANEIVLWHPWYCVPRPSGARSGGQIVKTAVYVQDDGALCWTPCGTMLALSVVHIEVTTKVRIGVGVLDWRLGKRLQLCSAAVPAINMYESSLCGLVAVPGGAMQFDLHLSWASSGTAIHLAADISTKQSGTIAFCSFVAVLPE